MLDFAPMNWSPTLARPEAQKLLAADRFRRLTLDTDASERPAASTDAST